MYARVHVPGLYLASLEDLVKGTSIKTSYFPMQVVKIFLHGEILPALKIVMCCILHFVLNSKKPIDTTTPFDPEQTWTN